MKQRGYQTKTLIATLLGLSLALMGCTSNQGGSNAGPSVGSSSTSVSSYPIITLSSNTLTFHAGVAIPSVAPINVGGAIASCTTNPALPAGFVLDASTCTLSGTPSVPQASTSYTIIATNTLGSSTVDVNVTILPMSGGLDLSFNTTGIQSSVATTISSVIEGLLIMPDNSIVLSGAVSNTGFAAQRFNADGSVNSAALNNLVGVCNIAFAVYYNCAQGAAHAQRDGKILVGYSLYFNNLQTAIVRYNNDGTIDSNFGTLGVVTIGGNSALYSVPIRILEDVDNKIYVLADQQDPSKGNYGQSPGVTRLNTDGSLDLSFGTGGTALVQSGSSSSAMDIDPTTKQIYVGINAGGNPFQEYVVRLNSDGTLDTGYGVSGLVDLGTWARIAMDITFDPTSGKLVIASNSDIYPINSPTTTQLQLKRLTWSGAYDTSFGVAGTMAVTVNNAANNQSYASERIKIDPVSGKILLLGLLQSYDYTNVNAPTSHFLLSRFNEDGTFDTSYGPNSNGRLEGDDSTYMTLNSMEFRSDGTLALGGISQTETLVSNFMGSFWRVTATNAAVVVVE
jgi:uncharacterized delta-60 repeat protein